MGVALRFSLRHSRLKPARSIRDSVDCNGSKHLPIEPLSVVKTAVRLVSDQGLKRLKDLKRRLETDESR